MSEKLKEWSVFGLIVLLLGLAGGVIAAVIGKSVLIGFAIGLAAGALGFGLTVLGAYLMLLGIMSWLTGKL